MIGSPGTRERRWGAGAYHVRPERTLERDRLAWNTGAARGGGGGGRSEPERVSCPRGRAKHGHEEVAQRAEESDDAAPGDAGVPARRIGRGETVADLFAIEALGSGRTINALGRLPVARRKRRDRAGLHLRRHPFRGRARSASSSSRSALAVSRASGPSYPALVRGRGGPCLAAWTARSSGEVGHGKSIGMSDLAPAPGHRAIRRASLAFQRRRASRAAV